MSVRLDEALLSVKSKWQNSYESLITDDKKLISRYPQLDVLDKVRSVQREIFFDKRVKKLLENVTYISRDREYFRFTEHHFKALFHINMHCDPKRITINGLVKVRGGRIYMRQNLQGMATRMKMSVSGAKKALHILRDIGVIFVKQLDPDPTNKANYYSINYEKLFELAGNSFSQMFPNLPTLEAFVDKSPECALHGTKVIPHIECNINENNIINNISKEEVEVVDKIDAKTNRFSPKTNFFGKALRYLYNKFDNYSANMKKSKKQPTEVRKHKREYISYAGAKFKSNDLKSTIKSTTISEKNHDNEGELCGIVRHKLKALLGIPAYVSWFNDVKLKYCTDYDYPRLSVQVETTFLKDYFKNNFLHTLRRISNNLAIKEVEIIIKSPLTRAEIAILEQETKSYVGRPLKTERTPQAPRQHRRRKNEFIEDYEKNNYTF